MSTSVVEFSGEKVKAMWNKRLIEIFCDICIKEILKGIEKRMEGLKET
ncbi:hypothetical protein Goklo_015902 [Gossypium klotzschianum]|uniref:Uncharacterized protein n=1 Tax=Gossypium klotzschianum TaxID=34286 RepID=A0A7J8UCK0_9ROSI|nr:hypothetical protein [Gossypium klotzschianum]